MADAPPSRYKVIERDRTLTVVDTWASDDAAPSPVTAPIRRTAFDGRATLTTHAAYDAKGPRTVALGPDDAAMVTGAKVMLGIAAALLVGLAFAYPWALLAPAIVFAQPRFWKRARLWTTAWLDRASGE